MLADAEIARRFFFEIIAAILFFVFPSPTPSDFLIHDPATQ
jgi:hypothetical protein